VATKKASKKLSAAKSEFLKRAKNDDERDFTEENDYFYCYYYHTIPLAILLLQLYATTLTTITI